MLLEGATIVIAKSNALTFPIEPGLRNALCTASHHEHRSSAKVMKIKLLNDGKTLHFCPNIWGFKSHDHSPKVNQL